VPLRPEETAAALASGRVAAWVWVTLAPAQAVMRVADTLPFRLLPLDDGAIGALSAGPGALLSPAAIPAGSYPGQGAPVPSLATPALLVATESLRSEEAGALLALLFGAPAVTAQGGPAAVQVRPATARETGPVPQHPGAAAFYARGATAAGGR
jgi:TRAP-type uncharacterized transport system substrate-binding protein